MLYGYTIFFCFVRQDEILNVKWQFAFLCLQIVGKFIARAVADDCLPPKYIQKYRTDDVECPHTLLVLSFEFETGGLFKKNLKIFDQYE